MNWKVVIIGNGNEAEVREIAASLAKYLKEDKGVKLSSAEFQAEKPEESLDLIHADVGGVLAAFRTAAEPAAEVTP